MRTQSLSTWALLLAAAKFGAAQDPPPAMLAVEIDNLVIYQLDTPDVTKLATDPKIVPNVANRTFTPTLWLADITGVNGKPARGTWTARGTVLAMNATISPGGAILGGIAIGDSTITVYWDWVLEIQNPDGTPIGTLMLSGWGGTPPPPGAPSTFLAANMTITGGTGAFLGMRGQGAQGGNFVNPRIASAVEDPANRRVNGGGRRRYVYHLLPLTRPEIINTVKGPAIVHASDYSLVSAANPAKAGETLSLFATGLGPARPGVDPGQAFPATPLQVANSPVEVLVNGVSAPVSFAGGFPGSVGNYQVNFRVPDGTSPGTATVGLTAAFIPGPTVQIPTK